ncbi:hypothetical protein AYI70_g9017 [Smittium culicis]|uniref:Uncharacterized protein n=1 Tax=Smittium culicis TaxID=133412 RepID=A0A1R1XDB8_9FUNG|nr:hypothetical protein AYI70_g9017 [Smittium culicis]
MVSFTRDIQHSELNARPTRCGPVCIPTEHKDRNLLQLVPKFEGIRPELEPNLPSSKVGQMRTSSIDSGNANVEVSHLIHRTHGPVYLSTTPPAVNDDHTRSKKRKISALDKQVLELDSIEDQQRLLKAQGLSNYAIDCLLSNKRHVQRRSRFSSVQQRYLYCRISNEINSEISVPQIINYLEEINTVDKLRVASIKS